MMGIGVEVIGMKGQNLRFVFIDEKFSFFICFSCIYYSLVWFDLLLLQRLRNFSFGFCEFFVIKYLRGVG